MFLAHRIPYPPNKGDKIRTFNQVKHLSRSFDIDLLTLVDDRRDLVFRKKLAPFCRSVHAVPLNGTRAKIRGILSLATGRSISEGYFFHTGLFREFQSLMQQNAYHAVFGFSSPMAAYVMRHAERAGRPETRLVMDFCDVDSDKWRQYSGIVPFPMNRVYGIEARRLMTFEKKVSRYVDCSVFVSDQEAELFQRLVPDSGPVVAVPNGVDTDYFSPAPIRKKPAGPPTLMFSGVMDYYANTDGVRWFCRDILPLVLAERPDVRVDIVGSNPTPAIRSLADDYPVRVTGFVEDIRPYYRDAAVCVVPLKIARGIQNKVLEAMAMGRPVVTTPIALEGIPASHGVHLRRAGDAREFAAQVLELLADADTARQTGQAARQFVRDRFSWATAMERLSAILSEGTTDG